MSNNQIPRGNDEHRQAANEEEQFGEYRAYMQNQGQDSGEYAQRVQQAHTQEHQAQLIQHMQEQQMQQAQVQAQAQAEQMQQAQMQARQMQAQAEQMHQLQQVQAGQAHQGHQAQQIHNSQIAIPQVHVQQNDQQMNVQQMQGQQGHNPYAQQVQGYQAHQHGQQSQQSYAQQGQHPHVQQIQQGVVQQGQYPHAQQSQHPQMQGQHPQGQGQQGHHPHMQSQHPFTQGQYPQSQGHQAHQYAQQGQARQTPHNQNGVYQQHTAYMQPVQQDGYRDAQQAEGSQPHRHRIETKADYKAHQKELKAQAKADKKAEKARIKAQKKAAKQKWPLPLKIGLVAAIVVVVAGIGLIAGTTMIDRFLQGDKTDAEMADIKETLKGTASIDEPFYMLLIGSDEREGEADYGRRSDSVILARIDPVDYVVTLVSIQRDIKMGSDDGAYKFNAEYANGGAVQCISAAQKLLDVDISHYAEVNFSAFINIVDAVGGIDVYIGETIDDWWAGDQVIEEGWQHLDGEQALIVARARHYGDDDYTRSSYQRTIIQTVINKIMAQPLTELPKIVSKAAGYISTDLSATDIFNLAVQFKGASDITMYSADLPSTQANINGVSYVILDMVDTRAMLKIVDEGGDPNSVNLSSSGVYIGTRIENEAGKYDENGNLINGS